MLYDVFIKIQFFIKYFWFRVTISLKFCINDISFYSSNFHSNFKLIVTLNNKYLINCEY